MAASSSASAPPAEGAAVRSAAARSSGRAAIASTGRVGPRSWSQYRVGKPAWNAALALAFFRVAVSFACSASSAAWEWTSSSVTR